MLALARVVRHAAPEALHAVEGFDVAHLLFDGIAKLVEALRALLTFLQRLVNRGVH